MKSILSLTITIVTIAPCFTAVAQEKKERGNNDYTNNRSRGEENEVADVNTNKTTPFKIIEYLPGSWVIEKVYRGKDDITLTDTLAGNESIEFNRAGRYISYSGADKIDSGAYRISEQHAVLYLASEADDEKSTEWHIWFPAAGTMAMKLRNDNTKEESFSYIYRKNGIETTSTRENRQN